MFCSKCGEELPDNSLFCSECGATVAEAKTSKKLLEIIIMPSVVIVGLAAAVIVLFLGNGAGVNFDFTNENVNETSDFSESGQSSTITKSEQQSTTSTQSEPEQNAPELPAYGSMGSVTILGVEYDVATTTILSLSNRNITNNEVKQIAQLTNLTWLKLFDNQINDITPLAGLTNLTYLFLQENQISDSDIEQLKAKLPDCYIS